MRVKLPQELPTAEKHPGDSVRIECIEGHIFRGLSSVSRIMQCVQVENHDSAVWVDGEDMGSIQCEPGRENQFIFHGWNAELLIF